ncbi:MAG: helix-turn-helix domain-containing protein [Prevotellaceae bacterium]|jgi:excisionase family DNA binding protein|nr:helix-turn-helix domain-containing protein [Prevotellaceae bacterium]
MNQIILHAASATELKDVIAEVVREQLTAFFNKDKSPDTRLFTRKEACKKLGVSNPTIIKWTKTGVIPAIRIGSSIRYRACDVDEALENLSILKYRR